MKEKRSRIWSSVASSDRVIERLRDPYFEHQHGVIGRHPPFDPSERFSAWRKTSKIDQLFQPRQLRSAACSLTRIFVRFPRKILGADHIAARRRQSQYRFAARKSCPMGSRRRSAKSWACLQRA